jgi:predicted DNA-binding protein (MmcQ/YjbR family)
MAPKQSKPGKPRKPRKPRVSSALARVRRICLALPGATEKEAWGAPTFRAGKMFAMFVDDHHGDGRLAVWCKAETRPRDALAASDPEHFFVPPYVGPSGWLGLRLDRGLDWGVIAGLLSEAHQLVVS